MPSLSYSSDGSNLSPVAPHYSSKFMDNSPSSLDPNASVYQPLKKWLRLPILPNRTWCFTLSLADLSVSGLFFFSWKTPDNFCTPKYHRKTHKPSIFVCIWLHFQFGSENYYFQRGGHLKYFSYSFRVVAVWPVWTGAKGTPNPLAVVHGKATPASLLSLMFVVNDPTATFFLYSDAKFWWYISRLSG